MGKIEQFLSVKDGYGYGFGCGCGVGKDYGRGYDHGGDCGDDGDGHGDGYGYGSGGGGGDGSGYGSEDTCGDGYSSGSGYGYGYTGDAGVLIFGGHRIYRIDSIPTIITNVKNGVAKGYLLNDDLTLTPTFVAKKGRFFAHGESIKQALLDVEEKFLGDQDFDEKIRMFNDTFEVGKSYPVSDFFLWHGILTGSCKQGRLHFMQQKGLSMEDTKTVSEFVALCGGSYGGEIIKKIKKMVLLGSNVVNEER